MANATGFRARTLTLVRHGQSTSNVTRRWQGHGDSPLSPVGREQAERLAERLERTLRKASHTEKRKPSAEAHYHYLISSDLSRAASTARALAKRLGREPEIDRAWREIDVGAWEGLTRDEVAKAFPGQIESLARGEQVSIGGGESWTDLAERTGSALARLLERMREGQHALVFAHGGVITSLLSSVLGVPFERPRRLGNVNNTGVTTLRFEEERVVLLRYNDTAHLGSLGPWGEERRSEGATIVRLVPSADSAPGAGAHEANAHSAPMAQPSETDAGAPQEKVLHEKLRQLRDRHPGGLVTMRAASQSLGALADRILGVAVAAPPRLRSHVVVTEHGPTLADFNVG